MVDDVLLRALPELALVDWWRSDVQLSTGKGRNILGRFLVALLVECSRRYRGSQSCAPEVRSSGLSGGVDSAVLIRQC